MAAVGEPKSVLPPRQLCQAGSWYLPRVHLSWQPDVSCAYPAPSFLLAPTRHCGLIILTPRSRLTHGVRLQLEIPSREVWCEEGRQTDICGVTFTDRQIIARRKPHALPPSSSDWPQTQPDAVTVVSQRPSGAGRGRFQQLLQHSPSGRALSEHLTLLRTLRAKGCHTPMRMIFKRRGSLYRG